MKIHQILKDSIDISNQTSKTRCGITVDIDYNNTKQEVTCFECLRLMWEKIWAG